MMNTPNPNDDWDNPYKAPESLLQPEQDYFTTQKYFWLRILICLQVFVLIAGIGASFVKIESILVSGPALAAAGIAVAVLARRKRNVWAIILGISAPVFSVFLLLLIYLLDWTPDHAKEPVPKIGLAYLSAVLILVLPALLDMRSNRDSGHESPPI
ncbi:MAG TPA: hypothetical protein PLR25_27265 [Planctomycetaceae bacterium]|nr:hypothetical protein [Planctomycetaceae bacterium]